MRAHRIVFLDRATIHASFRKPSFPHTWIEHAYTAEGDVIARLDGATIAVTNKVPLGVHALAALDQLQMIAVAATGVDVLDLAACRAKGVLVSNVRDYATSSVPEHAMMLALALRRKLFAYRESIAGGAWQRADNFCLLAHPIEDLAGSIFGVIGYGALGAATARIAEAFGMQVLIAEHKDETLARPGRVSFAEVLRRSDVLSLHAPLTSATRHMIAAPELRAMKPTAVLINTARGGLVHEGALKEAITSGWIAGAGFDVLEKEPAREGSPLLDLAERTDVILTPHVAWSSRRAMQTLADQVIENLEAYVRGAPRNLVA